MAPVKCTWSADYNGTELIQSLVLCCFRVLYGVLNTNPPHLLLVSGATSYSAHSWHQEVKHTWS